MKRWIAPSILALFVVGMLIYGINFYQQEQIAVSYTHLDVYKRQG